MKVIETKKMNVTVSEKLIYLTEISTKVNTRMVNDMETAHIDLTIMLVMLVSSKHCFQAENKWK